jgi:hypothetical protein
MKNLLIGLLVLTLAVIVISGCGKKESATQVTPLNQEVINSIVNVPNSNGSMTPVLIRREGNLWYGPRGEVYSSYPTVEQLKSLYGM